MNKIIKKLLIFILILFASMLLFYILDTITKTVFEKVDVYISTQNVKNIVDKNFSSMDNIKNELNYDEMIHDILVLEESIKGAVIAEPVVQTGNNETEQNYGIESEKYIGNGYKINEFVYNPLSVTDIDNTVYIFYIGKAKVYRVINSASHVYYGSFGYYRFKNDLIIFVLAYILISRLLIIIFAFVALKKIYKKINKCNR